MNPQSVGRSVGRSVVADKQLEEEGGEGGGGRAMSAIVCL